MTVRHLRRAEVRHRRQGARGAAAGRGTAGHGRRHRRRSCPGSARSARRHQHRHWPGTGRGPSLWPTTGASRW